MVMATIVISARSRWYFVTQKPLLISTSIVYIKVLYRVYVDVIANPQYGYIFPDKHVEKSKAANTS